MDTSPDISKLFTDLEKYKSIIDNIKECYFEVDLKGNFTFFNDSVCNLLGYSREELLGLNYKYFTDEETKKIVFKGFNTVYETDKPLTDFQYQFRNKKGDKIIGETSVYLKYDANGNKIGFYGLFRDITKKKKEEERFKEELENKVQLRTKELRESEEKYSNLFHHSIDAIFLHDLEGNIIDANQRVLEQFGYTRSEILKLKIPELHPIEELELSEKAFEEISKKGVVRFEISFKKKNGEIFFAEVSSSLFNIGGKKVIQGIVRDITERVLAEQKLRLSEEKYRLITENANDMIAIINQHYKLEFTNENTVKKILGYSADEILDKYILDFIHPDDIQKAINSFKEGAKKGENVADLRFKHKDGTYVYLEITGKRFITPDREYKGILISRDITEKKKSEQKIKDSEEKHRDMINNLDLGFYQLSWDGILLNHNPAFSKILGFDPSENLINKNVHDFWQNPEERLTYLDELKKVGYVKNYLVHAKKKNDEKIVLHLNSHILEKNKETPNIIQGLITDITEKFKLEQKLKESEERHRNLFESLPFSVALLNQAGKIVYCNPATEIFFGYKMKDLIGQDFRNISIIHPSYLPLILKRFKKTIKGENLSPIEIQIYKKNGNLTWINYHTSLVYLGNESLLQAIIIDISEQKQAEILIKEEMKKLKELDQIRKDLISRVSHELKTPLVSVCGGSELLLQLYKTNLDADVLELLELIEKGGKRLKYLVDNLLDITRIEYNKFKLNKEFTDLTKIIKDCAKELLYLARTRRVNLNLKLIDNLYLEIDKIRVEQVIINLLSNAIKNTPPKGKVEINLQKNKDWAEISVFDTGIGLTKGEMNLLFTRFGKIERYGEGLEYIDIQGSGLGLYISKQIVDLHGGQIRAESAGRNKGSRFIVKLPI
ncbi:MAG: PAS domain S-box protein [Candidatus Hodarchaeota archaeon]